MLARSHTAERERERPARRPAPTRPAHTAVLALQRTAGNASVARYLSRFVRTAASPTFTGSKARPMLRAGQTDPAVNELQEMLNTAGAKPPLTVTGTMDGPTRQAVVKFQSESGLNRDCIVGPLTWGALDRVTGTPSGTVGPDQHEGAHPPTAAEQDEIHKRLFPARGTDDTPWDGAGASPEALANRTKLKAAMHAAMSAALVEINKRVAKLAAADRMPIAKLEPAGKEAKRLADEQFKPLVAAAARTQSQESGLNAFDYTAGVNLFDAADTNARPPSAYQASGFIALSDSKAKAETAAHHLDRDRTEEEKAFFFFDIVTEFADANREPLERYHRYGFSSAKDGKVFAQTTLDDPKFSKNAPASGGPSPAERNLMWSMLHDLVHEYIHLLEHPAFEAARGNNDVMREGFCEMFTKDIMFPTTIAAKAGDTRLRVAVEGGDFPGFSPALVPDFVPRGQYEAFMAAAEEIRATAGPAAVKAAFFQGHVELLGLTPEGKRSEPAAPGSQDVVKVPPVVHTPFALGVMTGSSAEAIIAANPGLKPKGPLPALVRVPGCRYHRVVEAVEKDPATGAASDRQAESAEQIATQNGVTVADLERANPGLNRRVPKAGEELLIPLRA